MKKTNTFFLLVLLLLTFLLSGCNYYIINHNEPSEAEFNQPFTINFTIQNNDTPNNKGVGLFILRMPSNWYVINFTQTTNNIPEEDYLAEFYLRDNEEPDRYIESHNYLSVFEDYDDYYEPDPYTYICPTNESNYKIFYFSSNQFEIKAGGTINYSVTISTNNSISGEYLYSYIIGDSDSQDYEVFDYYTDWVCNNSINILESCSPDWSCIDYGSCINNSQSCTDVVDLNNCNEPYTGNYSEFSPEACSLSGYQPQYESGDSAKALTDGVAITAITLKSFAGLFVIFLLVGGLIVYMAKSFRKKIR